MFYSILFCLKLFKLLHLYMQLVQGRAKGWIFFSFIEDSLEAIYFRKANFPFVRMAWRGGAGVKEPSVPPRKEQNKSPLILRINFLISSSITIYRLYLHIFSTFSLYAIADYLIVKNILFATATKPHKYN
jgi:hypothetical protein